MILEILQQIDAVFWMFLIGQMAIHIVRARSEESGVARFSSALIVAAIPLLQWNGLVLIVVLIIGQWLGWLIYKNLKWSWRYVFLDIFAILCAGYIDRSIAGQRFDADVPYDYIAIIVSASVFLGLRVLGTRIFNITSNKGSYDDLIIMSPAITIVYQYSPPSAYLLVLTLVSLYVVRGMNIKIKKAEEALRKERMKILQSRVYSNAQEGERQKIAREIHDGPLQEVIAAKKMIESGMNERAEEILRYTIKNLRAIIYDMHPSILQLGLAVALKSFEKMGYGFKINFLIPEKLPKLSDDQMLAIYRITGEALSNISKHAEASQASVKISVQNHMLCLDIQDDGKGLPNLSQGKGLGLLSIREQAEALEGHMTIRSTEEGTRMEVIFPLESARLTDLRN